MGAAAVDDCFDQGVWQQPLAQAYQLASERAADRAVDAELALDVDRDGLAR